MPTHNTKAFLDTLVEVWPVTMQYRTDQLLFNTVIRSKQFTPRMSIHLLDFKRFLSGAYWRSDGNMKGEWTSKKKHGLANEMPDDFIILHASDVDSHKRKVTKFNSVQHWY